MIHLTSWYLSSLFNPSALGYLRCKIAHRDTHEPEV